MKANKILLAAVAAGALMLTACSGGGTTSGEGDGDGGLIGGASLKAEDFFAVAEGSPA